MQGVRALGKAVISSTAGARQAPRALCSAAATAGPNNESLRVISGRPDEHAARRLKIYRPTRAATQQGRGSHTKMWRAEFEKFEGKDRWTNPLMGWTSTGDPLTNAAMTFPTKEAAMEYATRNGYKYVVTEPEEMRENIRHHGAFGKSMVHQWRHNAIPVYQQDKDD